MPDMITVPSDLLHRQITEVFASWGMSPEHAATAATVMVETDLSGVDSHGIGMLPTYQKLFAEGRLEPKAVPAVVRDHGPAVLIDANKGIGHVASHQAMRAAMDKAKQHGIGVAGVTGSNHYGAAGWYARMAAEEGLVAISLTNVVNPFLVPVRGTERALGTNPIAFAAPTTDPERPVLLDMATTTVAYGKVNIARRADKPLPAGWAINGEGGAETDSHKAFESRRLAPLGGTRELGAHKGYGLALMVEILCATLTGARISDLATGHFFLVLDPSAFRDRADFEADMAELLGRMRGNAPVDPAAPVLIPGDPEHESVTRRRQEGIPVVSTLVEEVRTVCAASGASFLLAG
ncbi:Ldh family oxidoreductase [Roseococcus pinisoli]|uniref:Ldh family oxidoreductase n=1 Tax=Roseococcus pinisoli TaxID=2835040 RepID=A0ABS5QAZ0_9PROT|nr:Ldh family oxidoreductase [Roseococcus pinisoli]MBS7810867.1 Ldh family oxidoreductase [Roseococcus pinisoli]